MTMLNNPIHKRLEHLSTWQHYTFMATLCERMLPNYQFFCTTTGFPHSQTYQRILDLVWEFLTVKNAKIDFDKQLEKFEDSIPCASDYDCYAVYPAIDACQALSKLLHSFLSGTTVEYAVDVSRISIETVALFEMHRLNVQLSEAQLKENALIINELDVQWTVYRLLHNCEKHDIMLINGFKKEVREEKCSNIGLYSGEN